MSIADKLTLLINTKQDIKSAISEKGVEVTGGMTTYADAIRRIETGGGGGGDSFYVPDGLKFGYNSAGDYTLSKFTLPKLILADGYKDGSYMFDGNGYLTSINGIYSSNSSLINCESMFRNCHLLESIPQLDTSNVTNARYMFFYCNNLKSIPLMDFNKVTSSFNMLSGCEMLTDLGGFVNIKSDISLSDCVRLTHLSLMNVINNLGNVKSNTGYTYLTLSESLNNMLTDDEKKIATDKYWIIQVQ